MDKRLSSLLIPRRLSLRNTQQLARIYGPFIEIRCDGELQTNVIAYDVEAGQLERHIMKGDKVVLLGDTVLTEIIQGNVEVSWRLTGGGPKSY